MLRCYPISRLPNSAFNLSYKYTHCTLHAPRLAHISYRLYILHFCRQVANISLSNIFFILLILVFVTLRTSYTFSPAKRIVSIYYVHRNEFESNTIWINFVTELLSELNTFIWVRWSSMCRRWPVPVCFPELNPFLLFRPKIILGRHLKQPLFP